MPSAIRKKSYGSVTIYSVDKELVTQALNGFVAACRQRPEVLAVVLFGSFAGNWFGVGSDVDILIILEDSPLPFLHRLPLYQPASFPLDVDVFPYTWKEVQAGQAVAREALSTGRVLWQREGVDLTSSFEPAWNGEGQRPSPRSR
ncbi:MAG: nucleotidyltransferase domain-containing protein [Deltaproteobacteria bacterium]|nr:nucleotidyltransferase domain-containing protein [Deltaproteobacteria bacterium]